VVPVGVSCSSLVLEERVGSLLVDVSVVDVDGVVELATDEEESVRLALVAGDEVSLRVVLELGLLLDE
jgi:hypothetical protein